MVKGFLVLFLVAGLAAGPAVAGDPVEGVWAAPPDGKGQVGHIAIKPCGAMLCGTIVRAFAPNGQPVMTPNVGKRLFWNMKPRGDGEYGGGRVYVPAYKREYDAKMKLLRGGRLNVRGCIGAVCQGQVWTRVK